ncbi:MAG: KUP/HAK/KT family potassium transporter [Bifidobacteriaceae bacterium]|nr:KUP/HAK/KT family potassium transporter [Bifidobacteriaceae bacterium]MCI1914368.1 KUP/HAK/KT family potassium transporter [Bifidobacteriaceae bacterium]
MRLESIEDTGNIVPKGTITNAPKIDKHAISAEEREAEEEARREAKKAAKLQSKPARTPLGRWWRKLQMSRDKVSLGMSIVALGVVYGDIGTSPLYTIQSFISGQGGIQYADRPAVLGMLSLLFWSVTLITTVKYVLIAMRIDNKGEGGIFALYTLVRRYGKWLAIAAMLGGAAFLADSVLTPAVSISSAVEGLKTIPAFESVFENNTNLTLIITAVIIVVLFAVQSRGTERIGKVFGTVVMVWFAFLAVTGILNLSNDWSVFEALNPVYGLEFLVAPGNKAGLAIMGTVFLSTTGAEALYSDMGHVGRGNIYVTWPFIKIALVLCYFGQGAWILANNTNPNVQKISNLNPFFQMMDPNIRTVAVVLSVAAGVIASQALITGAFTMVSEATGLNWMPHLQVRYPARTRGQLYIPAINVVLCVATLAVLFLFKDSEHISAAYGLALTITMITTTVLLAAYIWWASKKKFLAIVFTVVFLAIQILFLLASLTKFFHGGWFTMALTLAILGIMYAWAVGTKVERSQRRHMSPEEFLPALDMLHRDDRIDYCSDNVVYLTPDPELRRLDTDIFYSIFADHPKRARAWWAVSVQVTDDPFTREYSVENFGTDFLFRVRLRIGFKINQNVATYLHQIMHDLIKAGELPEQATIYPKLDEDQQIGTIKYVLIHKNLIPESKITSRGALALRVKYAIRHVAGSPVKWFGLSAYNPLVEVLPLFVSTVAVPPLKRTALRKVKKPITLQAILAEAAEEQAAKEEQDAEKTEKAKSEKSKTEKARSTKATKAPKADAGKERASSASDKSDRVETDRKTSSAAASSATAVAVKRVRRRTTSTSGRKAATRSAKATGAKTTSAKAAKTVKSAKTSSVAASAPKKTPAVRKANTAKKAAVSKKSTASSGTAAVKSPAAKTTAVKSPAKSAKTTSHAAHKKSAPRASAAAAASPARSANERPAKETAPKK